MTFFSFLFFSFYSFILVFGFLGVSPEKSCPDVQPTSILGTNEIFQQESVSHRVRVTETLRIRDADCRVGVLVIKTMNKSSCEDNNQHRVATGQSHQEGAKAQR